MKAEDAEQVALVHGPVLDGSACAIYVARRTEMLWFVGGPDFTDDDVSEFRQIPLTELMEQDSSLATMRELPVGHYASRVGYSEPWSYGQIPVGPTFLVVFDVRPDESNPKRDELGGAIANYWVIAESLDSALACARDDLAATGWVIVKRIDARHASAEDFDHDPYFRQAQIDGTVAVFHTYPKDELELN